MSDEKQPDDAAPRQVTIPRPPSQADVDLISSQQGMIEDEWSGEPMAPKETEGSAEAETEGQPT
ncbi:hypothetical protein [Roseicella aquatilis]|uniref:Uncharacterized protein n=1 Tax=Roseicella aquatilis TaxID=2527868 RepID=A0A4R4DV61_9PROT|nr:hypothetical protein [Roseicella aquatilis]TCZ64353.1 hypothetical protein EXY23_06815 [Roseicella aquatilis]